MALKNLGGDDTIDLRTGEFLQQFRTLLRFRVKERRELPLREHH